MKKDLCLLHANCQGDALRLLLEASPEFNKKFEIRQFFNFKLQEPDEESLNNCKLFLHQYLAPKWGKLSTEEILGNLPLHAQHLCLPNFFFKGYWPFWTNKTNVIEFADEMLESLLERKLPLEAILHLYLRGGRHLFGDLEQIAQDSLQKEREKEKFTPVKYVDLLEERWRDEQLFLTVNHPGTALLFHAAQEILHLLDLPPLTTAVLTEFNHPQGDFWLPIHPQVGAELQLPFAEASRKYPCFASSLTHREYVSCYLSCRNLGIANLTGVLRGEISVFEKQKDFMES